MEYIYLTAKEAGDLFPRRLTAKQVTYRMRKGIRGVYLKSVTDGYRTFTTKEWVGEFLTQLEEKRPMPAHEFYERPDVTLQRILRL